MQDKWQPAQIAKMQAGGNAKAREFFEAGEGYAGKAMPIADKVSLAARDLPHSPRPAPVTDSHFLSSHTQYSTHFASQYKEKLAAEVAGESWTPSAAPAPRSALRKPRVGALSGATRGISSSSIGNSSNEGGYNEPVSQKAKK